jgi:hypothetical protein
MTARSTITGECHDELDSGDCFLTDVIPPSYSIVKVAESGLCLQAAKLGERNQELVEDECSASDDSKQVGIAHSERGV